MRNPIVLFTATSINLLFLSCTTAPSEDIAFSPLTHAGIVRHSERGTAVIRNQADFDQFWNQYNAFDAQKPNVDFSKEMVIGIFWGEGFSGCTFQAEAIQHVRHSIDGNIIVEVGKLPDLGPCRMIVVPYQMIRLARFEQQVVFTGNVP